MSDLTFNKVAGAVLATGLAIVGLKELSAGVFEPEEVEKPGYLVEVAEQAGPGGAAAEAPIDWGTVLPTADVAAGEAVFAKCKSCHTVEAGGANGTGPNLNGVVGRKPGSHAGFAYSAGMTDFGAKQAVWDDEHISEFIKSPQKYIAGTKMTFVGLKKPEDRINVIAYLRSQGGTLPVPAPNPAATAAPAEPQAGEGQTPAPGAAAAGQPTATGSTATPPAVSGGPAGQGVGAPAPAAPSQQNTRPTGNVGSSDRGAAPVKK
jgi:cytochrome c